jgi:hypothetical protein
LKNPGLSGEPPPPPSFLSLGVLATSGRSEAWTKHAVGTVVQQHIGGLGRELDRKLQDLRRELAPLLATREAPREAPRRSFATPSGRRTRLTAPSRAEPEGRRRTAPARAEGAVL